MAAFDGLKKYDIRLDLKKTLPMEEIELVAGDTGCRFEITVTDGGEAITPDGLYIVAVFSGRGGAAVQDSADGSITVDGGKVTIDIRPACLTPGRVDCELQLYSSTAESPSSPEDYDVLVTTKRFSFDCREPLVNGDAIPALPGMPALTALLNEISQAEQARAQAFAALAEAVGCSLTGEGAPTGDTDAALGRLYLDTQTGRLYVCTALSPRTWKPLITPGASADGATVTRNATYNYRDIPAEPITLQTLVNILGGWYSEINSKQDALVFDASPTGGSSRPVTSGGVYEALHAGDLSLISDLTLTQQKTTVTFTGFSCGELLMIMTGGMASSGAARVYVNGSSEYGKFASFAMSDCEEPEGVVTRLELLRPSNGFAFARRIIGGDPDGSGFVTSAAEHCAAIPIQGATGYTQLDITADGQGKFPVGTRFLLLGRN